MDFEINIGQIWRLKDPKKYYNVGFQDDVFIVLSRMHDVYKIGTFWWSGQGDYGGAREKELLGDEINEIGEYITTLKELLATN